MAHIFKLVKENVKDAPLEYGKETEPINEALDVFKFILLILICLIPHIEIKKR